MKPSNTPLEGPPTEILDALCKALRAGCFRSTACAMAGIHRNTLRNWLACAAAGDERYQAARQRIEEAEAAVESESIERIRDAGGDGDWKADAWWLEKRMPKKYGSRARVEHSGAIATTPMVGKSPEELLAIIHAADGVTATTDDEPEE